MASGPIIIPNDGTTSLEIRLTEVIDEGPKTEKERAFRYMEVRRGKEMPRVSHMLHARLTAWRRRKRYYHLVIMCTRLLMFEPSNNGTVAAVLSHMLAQEGTRGKRTYLDLPP
ncbi:hypothetical protein DMN91_003745 [Ooceraea biroi]|uniref:Uncharacterized protein n=1 Tax=Ooceraea biroi TaxID=2015173 RepID=A0A3L8DSY7_OOCBI|nr:hypothetical protein DMN91_003745 [Ooceraea biroi]